MGSANKRARSHIRPTMHYSCGESHISTTCTRRTCSIPLSFPRPHAHVQRMLVLAAALLLLLLPVQRKNNTNRAPGGNVFHLTIANSLSGWKMDAQCMRVCVCVYMLIYKLCISLAYAGVQPPVSQSDERWYSRLAHLRLDCFNFANYVITPLSRMSGRDK